MSADNFVPRFDKAKIHFYNKMLPSSLRMLIIGPSGCGKTTLLLKMLIRNLDFDDIVFCSPSLDQQDEYKLFVKAVESGLTRKQTERIFKEFNGNEFIENTDDAYGLIDRLATHSNHKVKTYNDPAKLPPPSKLHGKLGDDVPVPGVPNEKNTALERVQKNKRKILLVVDDCLTRKQQEIGDYFVYGRHAGINVVYLTQAYFSINKDTIRNNTEVFIVFEISDTDLKNSYEQLGAKEFDTLSEYKEYAREAWSASQDANGKNRGYFVVDLSRKRGERFRMNCF
jgi:GTPase SAR1 family protein